MRTPSSLRPRDVLLLAMIAFVALSVLAILAADNSADQAIRDAVLRLASPPAMAFMHVVNLAGEWRVLFPGTVLLLLVFEPARARWWIWIALMIVAPVSELVMKHVVGRPRPEAASFGFPSGHATAAAAFFGAVIYLSGTLPARPRRVVRTLAVAMILLVGTARVMLRAHWPMDVAGGAALGLAWASLAAMLASVPPASNAVHSAIERGSAT